MLHFTCESVGMREEKGEKLGKKLEERENDFSNKI